MRRHQHLGVPRFWQASDPAGAWNLIRDPLPEIMHEGLPRKINRLAILRPLFSPYKAAYFPHQNFPELPALSPRLKKENGAG